MLWLKSPVWIDALVQALCIPPPGTEPKAGLLHLEPGMAVLTLAPYRELTLFLSCPKELEPSLERVRERIQAALETAGELLAATDTIKMHVVWFGEEGASSWVGHTPDRWEAPGRKLVRYQVDGHGNCETRDGLKDWLEDALAPIRESGAATLPSTEAQAIMVARTENQLAEEHRFELVMASRPPRVTLGIVGLNLLLYVLESLWGGTDFLPTLWRMGADQGEAVWQGEAWRLLSSVWLHGGFVHLASNLAALLIAGLFMEDVLGARRYLLLYFTAGLAGNLLSAWRHPQTIALGASGAIFGLIAAMAVITVWPRDFLPHLKRREMRTAVWTLLVLDLVGSIGPDVDISAHVGGCLAGAFLVGSGLLTWRLPRPWLERTEGSGGEREPLALSAFVTALALVALGLTLGSIWMGFSLERPWEVGSPPRLVRTLLADTGVSMEIPAIILERPRIFRQDGWTNFIYGRDGIDPVVVDVSVARLDRPLTPQELPGKIEAYRADLEAARLSENLTRPVPPTVTRIAGQPAAFADQAFREGGRMPRWVFITGGDRHVDLEVVFPPGLPAAWAALEPRLVASLKAE